MQCDHCHQVVVDGVFCTRCGAHQGTTDDPRDAKARTHSYAAHPGEHVAHPGLITTLFPHLGQQKVHEFRWALLAGLAAIVVLWATGFVTAAILVAAFLVPVLYLIYLYEAQVYQDEPAAVVGFTIGGGAVLGIILTLITRLFHQPVPGVLPANPGQVGSTLSIPWLSLLGFAVLYPIIQEVVKPLPALVLRGRNFPETMDGLTFGVAAGVGFATAESIINFSAVIGSQNFQTNPGNWIFQLLSVAVLLPVMQGATTGIITASVWRATKGNLTSREVLGVAAAVIGHIAFVLGSQLLQTAGVNPVVTDAWQVAVVGCLLIVVRYLLHFALLEEGADLGMAEAVCPNCQKHVMAAGFCPSCGQAMAASPHAVRQARRDVADQQQPEAPAQLPPGGEQSAPASQEDA
ncbi:MAG TPA: PrsW family glutamic-type intramembrane protease [Candidatus Dormibacteraeota bacterium]|jgi:RsiW-degrading membrane proteinase PrsW (M82 family)|nr:PrsW family glutamic-type intramembrane protease [Candidatus Dormibacteraeota bacterium]